MSYTSAERLSRRNTHTPHLSDSCVAPVWILSGGGTHTVSPRLLTLPAAGHANSSAVVLRSRWGGGCIKTMPSEKLLMRRAANYSHFLFTTSGRVLKFLVAPPPQITTSVRWRRLLGSASTAFIAFDKQVCAKWQKHQTYIQCGSKGRGGAGGSRRDP